MFGSNDLRLMVEHWMTLFAPHLPADAFTGKEQAIVNRLKELVDKAVRSSDQKVGRHIPVVVDYQSAKLDPKPEKALECLSVRVFTMHLCLLNA